MKKVYLLLMVVFTTITLNAQNVLLQESFEGTFPPTGWVIKNNGSGNNWIQSPTANGYSGNYAIEYVYNALNAADAWAFTPALNLKAAQVTITFFTKVGLSSYPESMKLTVGSDSTVASQATVLLDSASITNTTYRRWKATYTPSVAGNYRFALNCYSIANQYNLYIDSIAITQAQSPCSGTPVAGSAISSLSNVCSSNVFLLSDTGSTSGVSGLTYQWQSSSDGSNWSNLAGATAITDSIKSQSVATYYRRVITCSTSGSSANSTAVLVGMNPTISCVCSPLIGNTLHSTATAPAIDTVQIVGTVLNNPTSTTVPTGGYTLYSDTTVMPSLQKLITYTLHTGYSANAIGSVWFDWNQSGTFDSTEWKQINTTGRTATISFTVPATANLGKTLMRIRSKSNVGGGTNTALNACTSFTTGETEDYLINIIAPVQCTGTPNGGTVLASANPICSVTNLVLTDTGSTTGIAGITYQWQSSVNGTNWTDIVGATGATDTVKGLATATYFRRATVCTASSLSGYSNGILINVNPASLCVCSPLIGNTLHSTATAPAIDTVQIVGTVLNNPTSTTVPAGGYTLYSDTAVMPSLQQSLTYTLHTGYSANAIGSVWFDWDQSGTFDSTEWKQINTTGRTATISFTVPANATLGKALMRIRSKSNVGGGTNTALNACTSFTTGETEDYLINIIAPVQCTGTPNGGTVLASANPICSVTNLVLTDTGSTTGIAGITYQWQSSVNGTNWTDIVGATGATDTVKGLATATYFRRATVCTASSLSGYSNGILINVNPASLCVCSPLIGNTLHSTATAPAIDTVQIVGTVLNNPTSTTVPAGGYTLYSDTALMPSLQQSLTYTLHTGYSANAIGSVWFDWDQSGTFDSTEWKQINTTGRTATISFTVPANATLGKALMRIRSKSNVGGGTNTALNACTSFTTGETEDYLINIIAPIQCTGTPNGGTVLASANPICSATNLVLTDTGSTTGIAGITYQWQSSVNGTNWTDIVGATSATDTVKGLATATYFRRATVCTASSLSGYSNGILINVNPAALCVCSPLIGNTLHSTATAPAIDTVQIVGTVLNNATSATVPTGGYTLYSDTAVMPSLQQSLTYTLHTGYSANTIGSVWFDWDQSGTFDSTEWKQINTTGRTATISFTVPATANLGKTLMRIRSKSTAGGGTNTALNACSSFTTGETEDYLINIVAPVQCTGTPNGGTVLASANPICSATNLVLTDTGSTTGIAGITYQWQSSVDGTNWTDIVGATGATDTVKGLATATYFRRATVCTASSLSGYSNGILINVNPASLCVCSPLIGNTLHSTATAPAIDTVQIVGTVLNNPTSTTVPTGGYTLYSDTALMPSLQQSLTYTLHTGYSANTIGSVWFDWDQSGTFDSTEWKQINTTGRTATISFTVPATANLGKTLMRIRSKINVGGGTNTALNACTSFTTGETEDYLINIVAPVQCTGTPNGGTVLASANPICSATNLILTDTGSTTGIAGITYQWQSSVNGTNWTDIVGATGATDTVKGLATATYFRRATVCTASSLSGYSNGILINVNPASLCVCSPLIGNTLHSTATAPAIDTVQIVGTVLNNPTSTTVPAGGYTLYSDTAVMPSLQQSLTYTLHTGYSANAIGSVWFDWDQSGTFDSTEWKQINTTGRTATISFTVPANATLGKALMRIRSKINVGGGTNTALNACTSFTTGETEDYLINIIAPVQCTGTPNGGTVLASANPICSVTNLVLTDTGSTTGIAGITYQWQSSVNGTNWTDIVGATGATDTVKGLATATYFRRLTNCTYSGLSGNSNAVLININPTAMCVCSPSTGVTLHSAAVGPAVDTVSILGTALNYTFPTTVPAGGYILSTDTTKIPSLQQQVTYTLQTAYSANAIGSVWFDWDQSGTFDSTEWKQINTTGTRATITFTVPANATLGKAIMRIRSKNTVGGGTNTALNACTTFTTGETEDFLINVLSSPTCWAPVNPTVTNINSVGGTVSWTAPTVVPSNGYIVAYNTTNDYATATVATSSVSVDSFKLAGLSSNTLYYIWVLGNCGSSTSIVSTTTFTTNCGTFSTFPINEGFESLTTVGAGLMPKCWTAISSGTNFTSAAAVVRNNIGARTGTHYIWARRNVSAWLISPAVHLMAGQSYSFSYYYRPTDTAKGFVLNTFVGNASDTTTLSSNNLGTVSYPNDTSKYTQALYNYTPTVTGDYYFAIQSSNKMVNPTQDMAIDDISIASSTPVYQVQGNIVYPNNLSIPNTTLKITGSKIDSMQITGAYTVTALQGTNITLIASKNNDVNKANGVTTLDLALVQSHILSKNLLNSPYKIIAADVNGDNKITTLDLVYMKRMILGLDTIYPSKKMWVFVDSNYVFPTPSNPFPYKDSINFIDLTANRINQTFIGIKLGDVNWDWNPLLAKQASIAATKVIGELKLETDDKVILK